jgi:hypothetical protein
MANAPQFYATPVKGAVDSVTALLASGKLDIYSGTQPAVDGAITGTRLARLTFGATAFPASSNSGGTVTATANAITSDTAAVAGTAGYFALMKSDGTTVVATGSVGTSGADLNLSSLTIAGGATVSCSAFTITQSQV